MRMADTLAWLFLLGIVAAGIGHAGEPVICQRMHSMEPPSKC